MHEDDRLFAMIGTGLLALAAAGWAVSTMDIGLGRRGVAGEVVRPAPPAAAAPRSPAVTRDLVHRPEAGRRLPSEEVVAATGPGPAWVAETAAVPPADDRVELVVATVGALAAGRLPRQLAELVEADHEVLVRRADDGRLVLAAGTFRRYTPLAEAVRGTSAADVAAMLRTDEAADPGLVGRAIVAADHLLATPVVDGDVEMESRVRRWAFADDGLEGLSLAQQHLVRMGETQAAVVRGFLRELRDELAEAGPPRPGGSWPPEGTIRQAASVAPSETDPSDARTEASSPGR